MKFLQAIVDNATAITGLLLAAIGLATVFGLDLSEDQQTAVMVFAGALIAALAGFLTTAKRTVVTKVDNGGIIRNGPASTSATGTPTTVIVNEDGSLVPQATVDPALAVAGG